ncbi:MAG: UbiA prenyltransferase family protein [Prolixibacteraceae bacterium]|jgi:decaprenyl-phosphate phosphoribosyltransferase|nr:UbiA prenyltransferase family protein [Prolixibacteraceae bacterium]
MNKIKYYIGIARPDHWFKNLFMIPGIILALQFTNTSLDFELLVNVIFSFISVCAIASANYTINEWIDAEFDKYHPVKKNRPSVTQGLKAKWVYFEYTLLAILGLSFAWKISLAYFFTSCFFLLMGFLYNVKPFRTKDKVYLDVISESINNPIRLCLGWFAITSIVFPPSSILISYWMGGAFLMGAKRFAEYRFINNPNKSGLYRHSFKSYNQDKLLISIFFYALSSSFFLGAFLIKHKAELILSFPLFSILFAWYLKIAFEPNSIVQTPEKLYKDKWFIAYVVFLICTVTMLIFIDIPMLDIILK